MQHLRRSLKQTFRPQGHVFRGWWLVGAGGTVQFLGAILFFQAFGAYFLLIEDEFGWSKALLAGAFSLARLESGMLGPVRGVFDDKTNPRVGIDKAIEGTVSPLFFFSTLCFSKRRKTNILNF